MGTSFVSPLAVFAGFVGIRQNEANLLAATIRLVCHMTSKEEGATVGPVYAMYYPKAPDGFMVLSWSHVQVDCLCVLPTCHASCLEAWTRRNILQLLIT